MECDIMKYKKWEDITKAGEITDPGNSLKFTTGNWRVIMPKWDVEKCQQCGMCWPVCPENAITVNKESGLLTHFDYDYCKGCGICAKVCPFNAIEMIKPE